MFLEMKAIFSIALA